MAFRDSFAYDFLTDFVPGFIAIVGVGTMIIATVFVAGHLAFGPPSCRAHGDKMGIEVSWGFWTDCMISVRGQWLPWSEVVPVERDGKIAFEPKPVVRLRDAR